MLLKRFCACNTPKNFTFNAKFDKNFYHLLKIDWWQKHCFVRNDRVDCEKICVLMKESIVISLRVVTSELYEKQSVFKQSVFSRFHSRSIMLFRQIVALPTINIAKERKSKNTFSIFSYRTLYSTNIPGTLGISLRILGISLRYSEDIQTSFECLLGRRFLKVCAIRISSSSLCKILTFLM